MEVASLWLNTYPQFRIIALGAGSCTKEKKFSKVLFYKQRNNDNQVFIFFMVQRFVSLRYAGDNLCEQSTFFPQKNTLFEPEDGHFSKQVQGSSENGSCTAQSSKQIHGRKPKI